MTRRNVALLTIILIAGALVVLAAPAYAGEAERPEICDDPAYTCQCAFTGGGWACFVTGPEATPTPEPTPEPTATEAAETAPTPAPAATRAAAPLQPAPVNLPDTALTTSKET